MPLTITYHWDFGDGYTSDEEIPTHKMKIDPFYGIIGWYSYKGGYKIAASQWRKI